MKDNFFKDEETNITFKVSEESGFDFSLIRPDNTLFKDEDYVPQCVLRIKHIFTKKQECWEFWKNNEKIKELNGKKFSENERIFLRSVEGNQLLLKEFKNNNIKFSYIKKLING